MQQSAGFTKRCFVGQVVRGVYPRHGRSASDHEPRNVRRFQAFRNQRPAIRFPCLVRMGGVGMERYGRHAASHAGNMRENAVRQRPFGVGKADERQQFFPGWRNIINGGRISLGHIPAQQAVPEWNPSAGKIEASLQSHFVVSPNRASPKQRQKTCSQSAVQVQQTVVGIDGGQFPQSERQAWKVHILYVESDDVADGGMALEKRRIGLASDYDEVPVARSVPVVQDAGRQGDIAQGAETGHDPVGGEGLRSCHGGFVAVGVEKEKMEGPIFRLVVPFKGGAFPVYILQCELGHIGERKQAEMVLLETALERGRAAAEKDTDVGDTLRPVHCLREMPIEDFIYKHTLR